MHRSPTTCPEPPPFRVIDPDLARLFAYWRAIGHGRTVPLRRDFDPVDIPYVLGYVVLVDVREAPRRYFVRVHGTEIARRVGYELTGKTIDHLPDQSRDALRAIFEAVARTGLPHRTEADITVPPRRLYYETLVLPLSRQGGVTDMLLSATHFFTPEEMAAGGNRSPHERDVL